VRWACGRAQLTTTAPRGVAQKVFQDLYDLRPAGRPGDWRKGNFHDVTSSIADSQLEGTGYHRLGVCPPGIQGSARGGAGRPIRSHDGHDRLPRTRGVFVIGVPRGSFHRPSARVIPRLGAADRPLAAHTGCLSAGGVPPGTLA
jgi:hypothetical protein